MPETNMAITSLLVVLKFLMILFSAGWVLLWLLKPTEVWTRKWKEAEESATATVFGYNGLNFAVYTFPVIALAMAGIIYLELTRKEPRSRQTRSPAKALSNPLIVNSYLGVISAIEILTVLLFILSLAWTFYSRVSNDFNKMVPMKNLKLNTWQYKSYRVSISGSLPSTASSAYSEGLAIFQLLGVQFEASVRYHVWLGTTMILFAFLHGAGNIFMWGKTGRIYLAGEITLVTGLVIWITSLPQIRRKKFEVFYYTHHLYIVFLLFFLFHGGDRHFYTVFAGIFLFSLDKLFRIIQSRPETCIVAARIFPCKAIELILPKDPRLVYTPTSTIFIKIPSISTLQWHSFSISSSSNIDEHTMSVIIRCDGWWTSSLYSLVQAGPGSHDKQMKCLPVAVEGPYGPASLDFLRYDSLLLIAGGIGITPLLSILHEIDSIRNGSIGRFPAQVQLIYVVKKSQDICLLDSVLPLLLKQASEQFHPKVKVFVTQEQSSATKGEILDEFSRIETTNFDRQYSNYAPQKIGNSLFVAAIVGFSSIMFIILLSLLQPCFSSHGQEEGL
ncbi:unnamed protein product [Thlaspi arvense]|uniref:FAD-binding FR-type domain-containing protein n=1 Tax=Thlaspi arvense TaxID=13288 RepID=A0AAU9SZ99_THLAR|nr:unnamed protein product [Thlaspi arvense]